MIRCVPDAVQHERTRDADATVLEYTGSGDPTTKLLAGESYADLLVRVRQWHETVARDTIAVAHGGVARTLIVHFGIEPPAAAPVHNIEQGVVYGFAPGRLVRYA